MASAPNTPSVIAAARLGSSTNRSISIRLPAPWTGRDGSSVATSVWSWRVTFSSGSGDRTSSVVVALDDCRSTRKPPPRLLASDRYLHPRPAHASPARDRGRTEAAAAASTCRMTARQGDVDDGDAWPLGSSRHAISRPSRNPVPSRKNPARPCITRRTPAPAPAPRLIVGPDRVSTDRCAANGFSVRGHATPESPEPPRAPPRESRRHAPVVPRESDFETGHGHAAIIESSSVSARRRPD